MDEIERDRFVEEQCHGGDLRARLWWTEEQNWYLREHGFPLAVCRVARDGLARLFPQGISRRMLSAPATARILIPAFVQVTPAAVVPLLRLGLAVRWNDLPRKILDAVRDPMGHEGGAFEADLWRNLHSLPGLLAFEPCGTAVRGPDFALRTKHAQYLVEAKTLQAGDLYALKAEVEGRMNFASIDLMRQGKCITLRASPWLRGLARTPEGREEYRRLLDEVEEAFVATARARRTNGTYAVGRLGVVEIGDELACPASVYVDLVDDRTPEEEAYRVLDSIRRAVKQLPEFGIGIVAVDVGRATNAQWVASRLRGEIGRNKRLSRCSMVVLRTYERGGFGPSRWFSQVIGLGDFQPSQADLRVAATLGE